MAASQTFCTESDNLLGPRVNTDCRYFDFTLLFEDAFFALLPSTVFLILFPVRLRTLLKTSVKVSNFRLAIRKLVLLSTLFSLHVIYTVFRYRSLPLQTKLGSTADILSIIASAAAVLLSIIEDQRSIEPSVLLTVYFSGLVVLTIPRLRSLWLIPSTNLCRWLLTSLYILTVLALLLESKTKVRMLRAEYQHVTREQSMGFWGRTLFLWVNPVLCQGFSKILSISDIAELDRDLQGDMALKRLKVAWADTQGDSRLIKAVFRAYSRPAFLAVIPRLALSGFKFCQPFLITSTINYFDGDISGTMVESKDYGRALIGAYFLVYLGMAVSTATYWRLTYRLGTMARAGLISIIYSHTTKLLGSDIKDTAALTLMGTDVERIVESLKSLHETWASVIEAAVALFLLERQILLACLVPTCISLACVIGAGPVSARTAPAQKAWVERVQVRLAVTSSFLGNMKAVKMLGLKDPLLRLVTRLRRIELETSSRFRKLLIWTVVLSNIPSDFAPYATFAVYAMISVVRNDQTLLASQAFTSLSLISLLTAPLLEFVQAVPALFESKGCFERIETYLAIQPGNYKKCPSMSNEAIAADQQRAIELTSGKSRLKHADVVISFKDVNISWSIDSEPVLKNLTLDIKRGITVIIGPVGSGKSALIAGIVGEGVLTGMTNAPLSNVAYCQQMPWLTNDTIQRNITGGCELDYKWYEFCVLASGLEDDLRAMPGGDTYIVGSDGVSLSGGQRQRVALARAIYSRLDVVVLDDPFSSLDTKCVSHITSALFAQSGYFRENGRSVIIATHNRALLPFADQVIVLNDGNVVDTETHKQALITASEIAAKSLIELPGAKQGNDGQEYGRQDEVCGSIIQAARVQDKIDTRKLDFSRRNGSWQVYKYYVQSAGPWISCVFIASFIMSTFLSKFSTLWIQWWSESNAQEPNAKVGFFIGMYSAFTVLNISCFILGCYLLFIKIINETASGLHADLLRATLEAPFSYFQRTDSGSITNRFSQDIDLIDMRLPVWIVNTVANGSQTMMNLIIFCAIGKYMAAFFPAFILTFFLIQSYYLRTSRQMRLLDIEAKAPLYTIFTDTIKGVATIKAFGWQEAFRENCQKRLDASQKPFYTLLCIQQWLKLVLDLVVVTVAVILLAITTSFRDRFSGGAMGVALNLLLTLNQSLVRTIESWTQLETSIGAVSRVQDFRKNTPSETKVQSSYSLLDDEWPPEGEVSLKEVSVSHDSNSLSVLKDVTMKIEAGSKIAVCGPSGSGKTTLILTLLRMVEYHKGEVLIDGKNLASLEPNNLRQRLNVISQEPLFVPGTLRFNLDFHGKSSDEDLQSAIRKVGLWERVSASGGLDMHMTVSDWSAGERQLLALARALNIRSPILILDEATSSVDCETELTIQRLVDTEFTKQTVIAVMHRHRFIHRYDRVALLRRGELIEYDSPVGLSQRDSEFKRLYAGPENWR